MDKIDAKKMKEIVTKLAKERNMTMTDALVDSGVGKNFFSNLNISNPSKKNISLLCRYFDVSYEYLIGEIDESDIIARTMGLMVEWLEDNEYDISYDDNGDMTIAKDGKYQYFTNAEFQTESLAVKTLSQEGYELAMLDWEQRHFKVMLDLTEDERFLLSTFRTIDAEGRARIIQDIMNTSDAKEKRHLPENKAFVG